VKYVVDTHALFWYLGNSPRLGPGADAALSAPDSELVLPAIALAEACWIIESGAYLSAWRISWRRWTRTPAFGSSRSMSVRFA